MILALVWTGTTIIGYLMSLKQHVLMLGWVTLKGTPAIVCVLVAAVVLLACVYGILRRNAWARTLAIGWYLSSIALGLLIAPGLLLHRQRLMQEAGLPAQDETSFDATLTAMVVGSTLVGLTINALVVGYLLRKKSFFRR